VRVLDSCYIDGRWVQASGEMTVEVVNPATEEVAGRVRLGGDADVDAAVGAARRSFDGFSRTSRRYRIELLESVLAEYRRRANDLAEAVTEEIGAPAQLAIESQVGLGAAHLATAVTVLKDYPFEQDRGTTRILHEPIGVCALITPWNWPLNQIACKVAPALAAGCTIVLKPSELAPFSASIFAEVLDAAEVPSGVFNLVHGDGPTVGAALSRHPVVDLVSITGSVRAGVAVAQEAAPTVKRVLQELGGKSPFIVLDDDELPRGVARCVASAMNNAGQSCNAPTRLLVPAARMDEAAAIARAATAKIIVGDPTGTAEMGPVASRAQWSRIQRLIQQGIDEGAALAIGGPGRPDGLDRGFYVKPTIFSDVRNDMTIAREEIFGPVLSILPYESVDEAIEISNDTLFGLAAYVHGADLSQVRKVAVRLRAGQIRLNGAPGDLNAPFGGYKHSGNGREWGRAGLAEYLETKSIMGFDASSES
jgi:aldehyde dehydrogenase (NAD+)